MAKRYTTRDLKREVDRLNKKYKKTNRTAIKFGFGKSDSGEYYIAARDNAYRKARKRGSEYYDIRNYDFRLSNSRDIGKIIKEVNSKDFEERNKDNIDRAHKAAMTNRKWNAYVKKSNQI